MFQPVLDFYKTFQVLSTKKVVHQTHNASVCFEGVKIEEQIPEEPDDGYYFFEAWALPDGDLAIIISEHRFNPNDENSVDEYVCVYNGVTRISEPVSLWALGKKNIKSFHAFKQFIAKVRIRLGKNEDVFAIPL